MKSARFVGRKVDRADIVVSDHFQALAEGEEEVAIQVSALSDSSRIGDLNENENSSAHYHPSADIHNIERTDIVSTEGIDSTTGIEGTGIIHAVSTDTAPIPALSKDKDVQFAFNALTEDDIPVTFLADSGATGNIIHPRLTTHLEKRPFACHLTFGNESQSDSTHIVTQRLTFAKEGKHGAYSQVFEFVVAATNYDIILGTPWFESLDELHISWKKHKRMVRFTVGGRTYKMHPKDFIELESRATAARVDSVEATIPTIHLSPSVLTAVEDVPVPPVAEKKKMVYLMPRSAIQRTLRQSAFAAMIVLKPEIQLALDDPELFKKALHGTLSEDGSMEFHTMDVEGVEGPYGKTDEFKEMLDDFKPVFEEPTDMPPSRPEDFRIKLADEKAKPPWRRIYRLTKEELEALRERLKELLGKGFIRPSNSPFGAPILFAKKKDGGLRLCIDYRMLNKNTVKDVTPLPNIAELRDRFLGAKFFTKIDLRDGYYNIRIAEEDIHKTAFQTRYGHFEFTVLPMGLTNAPATFMTMINRIFGDLADKYVVAYLDDILVYSNTYEEHVAHVKEVLKRLKDNRLYAKPSKCDFNKAEVEFCGHLVNAEGIKIHPRNIEVVQNWPVPKDVSDVRSFLGLVNYFRDFIPSMAEICFPLTELLTDKASWRWTPMEQSAMLTLIHHITSAPVLHYYDPDLPVHAFTDASGFGVSGWLGQEVEGRMRPVLFWSRKMKPAETRYVVLEQELLAIVDFLKKTRHYTLGKDLYVHTDHKALIYLDNSQHLSRRQVRWVELLQEFMPKIEYIPGQWNTVADLLSRRPDYAPLCNKCRNPVVALSATVIADIASNRLDIIRKGLLSDDFALEATILLENPDAIPKDRRHFFKHFTLRDGLLFYEGNRVYVPDIPVLRTSILSELHDPTPVAHPGWERMYRLLAREHYWPEMEKDVKLYTKSCDSCQRNKHRFHLPSGELHPLPLPAERWEDLGHDLAMLPMTKKGHDALDVWIDRCTKRVRLIPSHTTVTAEDTSEQFLQEIYRAHGLPKSIVSDRASTFTSKFAEHVYKALGVDLKISTARHQQTDGQAENAIKTVKSMCLHFANYHQDDWDDKIWALEFAFNNADNSSTGYSPFYLDTGRHPRTPSTLDLATPSPAANGLIAHLKDILAVAQDHVRLAQDRQAAQYNKRHVPRSHPVGSLVLLSREGITFAPDSQRPNALLSPWLGPFKVLEALPRDNYQLELPHTMRIHPVFHISKLTAYVDPMTAFPDRPLPSRPPPVDVDSNEYEVEAILDKRQRWGKPEYLVQWKGWEANSWEPAAHLNCKDLLAEFEASRKTRLVTNRKGRRKR